MNMQSMLWSVVWFMAAASACLGFGTARAAVPDAQCKAHAQAALEALTQQEFAKATEHFSPTMATHVPSAVLKSSWHALVQQAGTFKRLGPLTVQKVAGHDLLVAPMTFSDTRLDALVACDAEERISTFRLVPAPQEKASGDKVALPPVDKVPGVVSRVVEVPSPLGPLPALLDMPAGKGPFPAVVLVAGSGPNDLNEKIGPNAPFRDIGVGLAKQGVATLRFDKRTHVYGDEMRARAYTADDDETDDALSALKLVAGAPHVDSSRVFVLGHSEGALMAPRIAARAGNLAGIIMLAAPARPLLDVVAQQLREIGKDGGMPKAKVVKLEKAIAAEHKRLARADPADPPEGMFLSWPQSFWLSLRDYDPVTTAIKLHVPMLMLQGGKDYQVSPEKDFARWKKALTDRSNVTFHLYPGLFHLFMPGAGTPADYKKAGHVAPEVIDDIARWIKAR